MKNLDNNYQAQRHAQKHNSGGTDIGQHDLDRIAAKSDAPMRVFESIFQVNCDMRRRYAELMSGLIENLSPVIIFDNNKDGESTLICDATQEIEESKPSDIGEKFQVY